MVPSIAGPKRPQDRIRLADAKRAFEAVLPDYVDDEEEELSELDEALADTFPASDPFVADDDLDDSAPPEHHNPDTSLPSKRVPVTMEDGTETELDHGKVVIASITSCTNTSNPSVMLAAGLLARNAVEKEPGGQALGEDIISAGLQGGHRLHEKAGLWPALEALGYHLVGYGCTTCIGNSGPLPPAISAAVNDNDLAVVSTCSRATATSRAGSTRTSR